MSKAEFHNALRILLNIDGDEFIQAVYGRDTKPADDSGEWRDYLQFRDNPHMWFIRAADAKSDAIWGVVCPRQPHIHVGPDDRCAQCGNDFRDPRHVRNPQ